MILACILKMTGFMSFPIKNDNCCVIKDWHRMSLMTQLIDID